MDITLKSSPTYVRTAKESGDVVTLAEYKSYSNQTSSLIDALLQLYIDSAVEIAERYMNRDILTATYQTYRDDFWCNPFLEKGGYQSVESVEYMLDGTYQTLATTEYTVKVGGIYPEICSVDPPSHDCNCNAIRITFKAGFGDNASDVPSSIKLAILQIALFLEMNKGDCSDEGDFPASAKTILRQYKIVRIG